MWLSPAIFGYSGTSVWFWGSTKVGVLPGEQDGTQEGKWKYLQGIYNYYCGPDEI